MTPDELREQAQAVLAAGEKEARRALQEAAEAAERFDRPADELELAQRVEERRTEVARDAAAAAQAGLEARKTGEAATADADVLALRRAELEAALTEAEAIRRQRRDEVEQATARGDLACALELERSLGEIDLESIRLELSVVCARENDARDRAAQALAAAEQHAAEAAEYRRALELVEDELRPEYEQRREKRAEMSALDLVAFDQRHASAAIAYELAARMAPPPTPKRDSADEVLDAVTIDTDHDGRLLGVHLPLST